jgi:tRNA(Ile)-lysidine synthase
MASSRRSPPADIPAGAAHPVARIRETVAGALAAHVPAGAKVGVALSGGRDSIVLLDACITLVADRPFALHAIHVHHGLSPHADAWATFCAGTCAALGVPLTIRRVEVDASPASGMEGAARALRYEAIAAAAREAGAAVVLLAHHQDDQAETLLLQLARGAGPHGLRAMPAAMRKHELNWLRPLLAVPRAAIDAYASARGVRFIDDDSNADSRHRRNAVRLSVAPAMAAIFPGYPGTLARAATLQAESAQIQDDLAAIDAAGAFADGSLACQRLAALPEHRARNLLRWYLRQHGLRAPSAARLCAMLRQLTSASADARVRLVHDGAEIGVHRGCLVVHAPPQPPFAVAWRGEAALELPHGRLEFLPCQGDGLALEHIAGRSFVVRNRSGGERLVVTPSGPRRSLKHVLQEAGVPHWQRAALPLVFCDGALAAVPGVAVDAGYRAAPGHPGLVPTWREAPIEPGRRTR